MSSLDTHEAKLGLRERKKQQTREKIARVALELFAERGYDETTLADIAEAADVSARTIFAYYESKEDILFCEEAAFLDRLGTLFEGRPPDVTTIDVIREFLASIEPPDEQARLRKKVISGTRALEMRSRAHHSQLEPMLVASIARDLGAGPGDMRPLLIAASMMAAFMSVHDRMFAAEAAGEPIDRDQALEIFDQVLEFTRAGVEALQRK
jgi:AcrR family transcriptional regulator